jgi:hypothetical protein
MLEATARDLAEVPAEGLGAWVSWVRSESARMVAFSHWHLGDLARAREAFQFVATLTPYAGDRARYLDWAERCSLKQAGVF